jgi:hypothetical protein
VWPITRTRVPENELQPGFLNSGGSDQSTFLVALFEFCVVFGSISRLGVVSLLRLNARPMRPNAISKIPAIISQCGYSSDWSICPHKASTVPLGRGEVGRSETICWRYLREEADRVCPLSDVCSCASTRAHECGGVPTAPVMNRVIESEGQLACLRCSRDRSAPCSVRFQLKFIEHVRASTPRRQYRIRKSGQRSN